MDNKSVFVVTCKDDDSDEYIVTVFDNEEAANKCYEYFKAIHVVTWLNKCPLYRMNLLLVDKNIK